MLPLSAVTVPLGLITSSRPQPAVSAPIGGHWVNGAGDGVAASPIPTAPGMNASAIVVAARVEISRLYVRLEFTLPAGKDTPFKFGSAA
jgi:hypothetical protein